MPRPLTPAFLGAILPLLLPMAGPMPLPSDARGAIAVQHNKHPELTEVRRISAPTGIEWMLLTGPDLRGGRAGRALYIMKADAGAHAVEGMQPWHAPGRLLDRKDNQCYYEAHVFAGEVLPDTVGVIWYDRSLMPDGQWRENTTLLNLSGPVPDTLVFFGHGRRSTTAQMAFSGRCALLDSVEPARGRD